MKLKTFGLIVLSGVASVGFAADPEIVVRYNGTDIIAGDNTPSVLNGTDFGSIEAEGSARVERIFTITNTGTAPLTVELGPSSGPFRLGTSTSSIAPSASGELGILFSPSSAGTWTHVVSLATNDSDENPFEFTIRGVATEPDPGPEIVVEFNGTNIPDGDASPSTAEGTDFGNVEVGGSPVERTFRVRNTGSESLNFGSVTVSYGFRVRDTREFLVRGLATSVPPGGFDDFTISFVPNSVETKIVEIRFETNDVDKDPFNFTVRGRGVEPSGSSFARPSGWHWTQGEWEWSNDRQFWYWIPPGPPFVQNTSTGQVVPRPINGWNFYNWPYFWNADQGAWYFIFEGNLPYVLNPGTGQWRRWGE